MQKKHDAEPEAESKPHKYVPVAPPPLPVKVVAPKPSDVPGDRLNALEARVEALEKLAKVKPPERHLYKM